MSATADTLSDQSSAPKNFESAVEMTRVELNHHLRLMAALKMFELGQVSSGKAAELCGMTRIDFFETCSRYRVSPFNYPPEELEDELRGESQTLIQ